MHRRYKCRRYYLPKGIINNYNAIINRLNFYNQPIEFDVKRYKEIRKLTEEPDEDYTTGCFLGYDYIKNHSRLIAVDLSRQKELYADPKTIQQMELVGQLEKIDNNGSATGAGANQICLF